MQRNQNGMLIYSPSDLMRFMESPFASWMERLRLDRPDDVIRDEPSEELKLIAKTGNAHEAAYLQWLKNQGRDVCEVPRDSSTADFTRKAIQDRREVIFQGYLSLPPFAGYTDFLVRTADSSLYEVWDTKLARKVKPYYLIQLCCYAEMLESVQGQRPECICVVLGTDKVKRFRTVDLFWKNSRSENE